MPGVSRKVVRKSARNNLERYCGYSVVLSSWFLITSAKSEKMEDAMDVCLRVPEESNKSRFGNPECQEQCSIDHIPDYIL